MDIRNPYRRTGRVRTWQLLVALLALLATSAQQIAAQTHWHAEDFHAAAGPDSQPPDTPEPHHGGDCLLCHVASHAPAAAPPPAILLLLADRVSLPVAVPAMSRPTVPSCPSHAWLGRGPPNA